MPEASYAEAIRNIESVLVPFEGVRELAPWEMSPHKDHFSHAWEVPGLCKNPALALRVLVKKNLPYDPPRIAVAPCPAGLVWPHLEENGLLCLKGDDEGFPISNPGEFVLRLLGRASIVVDSGVAGNNVQDFESEFVSYWIRWSRTHGKMISICQPGGLSRFVPVWFSKNHDFVAADTEEALKKWIENRFSDATPNNMTFRQVPLLSLHRPLRPDEYPTSLGMLRRKLRGSSSCMDLLDKAISAAAIENNKSTLVMLEARSESGPAFAAVIVDRPDNLANGFRQRLPKELLLSRYDAASVSGMAVVRYDPSWVHGRDNSPNLQTLRTKVVAIAGLGALGSGVTELLAKVGVGKILLIDPQVLESCNVSRHSMGISDVGKTKVNAIADNLKNRFPHGSFEPVPTTLTEVLKSNPQSVESADLIIALTGQWSAESFLDALAHAEEGAKLPGIVYGWLEPHAAAGHALTILGHRHSLSCVLDDEGYDRLPVAEWSNPTDIPVPACGGTFQPYGAIELSHIQALVADLIVDVLLGHTSESTRRTWVSSERNLIRSNGVWNPEWIARYGNPGPGERVLCPSLSPCSNCGLTA